MIIVVQFVGWAPPTTRGFDWHTWWAVPTLRLHITSRSPPVGRALARHVGLKADLHFEHAMFRQL